MGQIKIEKNVGGVEGLCVIEPVVHGDSRGYFMETYSQRDMAEQGINIVFVQDNQSMSTKGVLRGLHFQKSFPQTKLVRVIKGRVFDVAVDLRADSDTYGKWCGVELSEENKKQFLIPRGFGTGFWCCLMWQSFAISVMISTIPTMKVVWLGTIQRLGLSGQRLLVNIMVQHQRRDIIF